MSDNPLLKRNPANTLEACIHHADGIIEILDKITGMPRSEKAEFAIINSLEIAVKAMESVYETIASTYLDDDKEVVVSLMN